MVSVDVLLLSDAMDSDAMAAVAPAAACGARCDGSVDDVVVVVLVMASIGME